jgi:hypothetical protein
MSYTPQKPLKSLYLSSVQKNEQGKPEKYLNLANEWPNKNGDGSHWNFAKDVVAIKFADGTVCRTEEDFKQLRSDYYMNFRDNEAPRERTATGGAKHTERRASQPNKYDDDPFNESRGGVDSYDDLPF